MLDVKKSDTPSLGFLNKSIWVWWEKAEESAPMRRNTRPSKGSMLWWKWVCTHRVDWQAWQKCDLAFAPIRQAAYAEPWTDNTKLSCPMIDRNPISGTTGITRWIRNRWRRSWIREEWRRKIHPPRGLSRAQGQTQINACLQGPRPTHTTTPSGIGLELPPHTALMSVKCACDL